MAVLSEGLPTLPAYVFELNGLLSSVPVDLKRVGEVIRTDPSLSAQVVRLCNSPLLNLPEPVASIEHAVVLLGTERLRIILLTCSLIESVGQQVSPAELHLFWQHSFLTGTLSARLGRCTLHPKPEQAYLAGLLHDIGILPLLTLGGRDQQPGIAWTLRRWGEAIEEERGFFSNAGGSKNGGGRERRTGVRVGESVEDSNLFGRSSRKMESRG